MTNIISLNQLVQLFKNFAERHQFINDFGYGPTSDIGVSRPMKFPYLWLTIDQNSEIVPQNRTTIPLMGFTVIFMDKTNIQENYLNTNGLQSDNRQETLSDTFQYLQDLVTEIDVDWNNYGIKFEGSVNCFPGVDETTDKVNGWVGQFRLKLKHSNCILPTGDIAQTNLTPINPMTRYLTCDTLQNCQVIQDIENDISTLQSQITGTTSGLTCDTLQNCQVIQDLQNQLSADTKAVGVMYLKNNDVPTPITVTNQRKVVSGTVQTGMLDKFIKDPSTNSLKYTGTGGRFHIITSFNFYEGNQRTCGFYIGHNTDDTTALDPDGDRISESEIYANSGNPSSQPIAGTVQTVIDLNTNDRVFFIVQNKDAATNITVEFMKLIVTEI